MIEFVNWLQTLLSHGIPCVFHAVTGLYCPGCGGTRSVIYLLHGQIWQSIIYHPLVPYIAAVILLEVISFLAAKIFLRSKLHIRHYNLFVYIGIGVILVNWIWKNYMLLVKGIDLLAERL